MPLMKAKYAELFGRYNHTQLPLCHWVPMLLQDVRRALEPDNLNAEDGDTNCSTTRAKEGEGALMTPNPLRVATALLIVQKLFDVYQIPEGPMQDLLSAVYVSGLGLPSVKESVPHATSAVEVDAKYDFMAGKLAQHELQDVCQSMEVLRAQTDKLLRRVQEEQRTLKEKVFATEKATLRMHFLSWKAVIRQRCIWRGALRHRYRRDDLLLEGRAVLPLAGQRAHGSTQANARGYAGRVEEHQG